MSKKNSLLNYFVKIPVPASSAVHNSSVAVKVPDFVDGSDSEMGYSERAKKRDRINESFEDELKLQPKVKSLKVAVSSECPDIRDTKTPERVGSNSKMKDRDIETVSACQVAFAHTKLDFLLPENIKDAKRRHLSDPEYDPHTLYVPQEFLMSLSPAMRQWWELKSKYFDCVLFFKVGKFYEFYHMDADIAVKELECSYMKGDFAHSGFPEISYDKMAGRLIDIGYKVARVEQTETPEMMTQRCKTQSTVSKFDRVVKREICQITSRGTQVPGVQCAFNCDDKPHYMLAIIEQIENNCRKYGICFVDTTIGDFVLGQFDDDKNSSRLRTLLSQYPPILVLYKCEEVSNETKHIFKTVLRNADKEIVPKNAVIPYPEIVFKNLSTYFTEKDETNYPDSLKILLEEGYPEKIIIKENYKLCFSALGLCIWLLQKYFIDERVLSMSRFQIYSPSDLFESIHAESECFRPSRNNMTLDSVTLTNLNLIGQDESLLSMLDQCCTKFGKRMLRSWLCSPSYSIKEIEERQIAVSEFYAKSKAADEVRHFFSSLSDFEKQLSQINGFKLRPAQSKHPDSRAILFEEKVYSKKKIQHFITLLRGLETLIDINEKFVVFQSSTLIKRLTQLPPNGDYPDVKDLLDFFKKAFDYEQALQQGIVAPEKGIDEEYDTMEDQIYELKNEMDKYLMEQRNVFGSEVKYVGSDKKRFQLEIPEKNCNKIPSYYFLEGQRKGSTPVRRYTTAETKAFLKRMMQLEEERNHVLEKIAGRIFKTFCSQHAIWKKCLENIAVLDVLLSLAAYAKSQPVVCIPKVTENNQQQVIQIEECYHPFMTKNENFIPNDIKLDKSAGSLLLLTGPNMGGKSTLMRQIGLISVLVHMGSFVPARSCKISLIDRIFTRLGAQDDIITGRSTFLVELYETSTIIKDATVNSLVLLDELGRGTATYDGTAVAAAVANFLADLRCFSVFSTHYHNLLTYFKEDTRVTLGHMSCMVENEEDESPTEEAVTFLYKLAPGICPKSYGFNAAKLAGIPNEITKNAAYVIRCTIKLMVSKHFAKRLIKYTLFQKIFSTSTYPTFKHIARTLY